MAALNAWYTSPEYQPLIALRKSCTSDQDMMFTMQGCVRVAILCISLAAVTAAILHLLM